MKKLSILGSTGSIGQSTLDVVARNMDEYRVVAIAAGRNLGLLEKQIALFSPELVAVADGKDADELRQKVNGVDVVAGVDGMCTAASHRSADCVVSAIVGAAGLLPTLTAVRSGKTVALANKESLVMAGEIVMTEARRNGVTIIPVDSEHSAVFQCLEGRKKADIKRIILTASGGPFVSKSITELSAIKAEDALRHPNWNMGKKITIDSATLMNKGLEVMEACWLFDLPVDNIDVLIHPQSIVHSLVEFKDRSCLAQMSMPDMRGPISYALSYPDRTADPMPGLELDKIGTLTFSNPDFETFPCLSYAYDAMRAGGTMPSVLNASNEVAVYAFLNGAIGFNDVPNVIRKTLDSHSVISGPALEDVLDADRWARRTAEDYIKELQI